MPDPDVTIQLPDEELPSASAPLAAPDAPGVAEHRAEVEAAAATSAAVRSARRRVAAFLGAFVLLLLALFTIDFLGNATGLYPSPLRPSRSERAWKTRRFDDRVKAGDVPQVLVLGSSRTMQISPPYLSALTGGKRVFNYGVSSAEPLDFLTILRHALEMNAKPQMIVVGVDEQAFGAAFNKYQIQLVSHWSLYRNIPFPERLDFTGYALRNTSLSSIPTSVGILLRPNKTLRPLAKTKELLLEDGYLIYRERALDKAAGKHDAIASAESQSRSFKRNQHEHELMMTPTQRKYDLMRQFLTLAHDNGIEVKVMLLPMQPRYAELTQNKRMRRATRDEGRELAQMCAATGATYRDFTDIASYGGDPNEFWDGVHQTPENIRRMINTLFGHKPDEVVVKVPTDLEIMKNLPKITTLTTP